MQKKEHWETVYSKKSSDTLSWFQEHANTSLKLIDDLNLGQTSFIIDIGGGTSVLVDELLENNYKNLSVLDISAQAINTAKSRLGQVSNTLNWYVDDITTAKLPNKYFDVWHDRAVFHFLTKKKDRESYIQNVYNSLKDGGHIIIGTFTINGPEKCSGLPIVQYTFEKLEDEFGNRFTLQKHINDSHVTPMGATQEFIFCHFIKNND